MKTAFRSLLRYKGFALINIASLTIGIVGCLLIGLFVWDEKQFDHNIPGGENIYRLFEERKDNGVVSYAACTPPAIASFLKQQYPEVDNTARMLMSGNRFLMEAGEKKSYEDKGYFVENSFLQIFPLKFLKGDRNTALTSPHSIVISEELAQKFFGVEDPIDKNLFIDKDTFAVKGVMAKIPEHFHLDLSYLIDLSSAGIDKNRFEKWTWHQFYTYVKLKPGTDVQQLQQKLQSYMKTNIFPTFQQVGSSFLPFFQQLKNIHLQSASFVYDNARRGNETYIKALILIALFVLVIACFNFINLATARSLRRAKEIGVRKVVGAERSQLMLQFVCETILLSVLSMVLAAIITVFLVPSLNQFTGKSIHFHPATDPVMALIIFGAGFIIGILAGIYPATVLSGFHPMKVLKNMKLTADGRGPLMRHALVIVQFSLSVLLIVSTIIVYRQTKYLNQKDLGFDKDQVVSFQIRGDIEKKLETFKSELRRSPDIVSVTSGYGLPGDMYAGDGISVPTNEGEKEYPANIFLGDYDYLKTLGLRLIAGRDFSRDMSTDERQAFIINETAVKELGFGSPEKAIGKTLRWKEWAPTDSLHPFKEGKVIGIVQDFHYKSLHEKLITSVIQLYPKEQYKIAAKLRAGSTKAAISYINSLWKQFAPAYPLDYQFMDESYGKMYLSEEKLSSLLWIFAIMAIAVGCMGLFGLAAFTAEQKTKEIGIRKVLGANLFHIVGLLSKNFLIMVTLASLIALPIAWWAMNNWLNDFPYRIALSWWVFALAVVAALLIAMITVSFQSIRAAIVNPVRSLRSE
ncbi:MAG: ABC transporter permease [Flavisolibacter sp.]